jgi:hypothetical protein
VERWIKVYMEESTSFYRTDAAVIAEELMEELGVVIEMMHA